MPSGAPGGTQGRQGQLRASRGTPGGRQHGEIEPSATLTYAPCVSVQHEYLHMHSGAQVHSHGSSMAVAAGPLPGLVSSEKPFIDFDKMEATGGRVFREPGYELFYVPKFFSWATALHVVRRRL